MMAIQAVPQRRKRMATARKIEIEQRIETAKLIALAVLMLVAFGLAGTSDYNVEQAESQRWADRGVVIQRW